MHSNDLTLQSMRSLQLTNKGLVTLDASGEIGEEFLKRFKGNDPPTIARLALEAIPEYPPDQTFAATYGRNFAQISSKLRSKEQEQRLDGRRHINFYTEKDTPYILLEKILGFMDTTYFKMCRSYKTLLTPSMVDTYVFQEHAAASYEERKQYLKVSNVAVVNEEKGVYDAYVIGHRLSETRLGENPDPERFPDFVNLNLLFETLPGHSSWEDADRAIRDYYKQHGYQEEYLVIFTTHSGLKKYVKERVKVKAVGNFMDSMGFEPDLEMEYIEPL
jgi:hypothetical protein